MSQVLPIKIIVLFLCLCLCSASVPAATAGESTLPAQYQEHMNPDVAAKYQYTEDGEYSNVLHLPTYEWSPAGVPLKAMVMGIHGLTLHGRRFRVLARTLAVNGVDFVSLDMRGFGRCYFDEKKQFSTTDDDKSKVNYEKSYDEIVQLAKLMKAKHPGVRLIAMGESLGCSFCVRLAAEHHDLVDVLILSAPAVRINRRMYTGHGTVMQAIRAVFVPRYEVDMHSFLVNLVSTREEVVNEMLDDPLIVKHLSLGALLSTDRFVSQTARWGKGTRPNLPVLIVQGSRDGCVAAKHVTELMNNMSSDDQTLAWRGSYGHLQLETSFMRVMVIDAVVDFLRNHGHANESKLLEVQQQVVDLGGTMVN